jgi:DNA-binding protein YbaB
MFNKLKQYKDLRDQAKQMQSVLGAENIEVEKNGVKIVMNGSLEIISITINESLSKDSLEQTLVDCMNNAVKKAQRIMVEKMQQMGGMPKFG